MLAMMLSQWCLQSERKLLDVEEQHNLMLHHNHQVVDTTDYLAPPPIPPEDIDNNPEVIDIV